jgi:glycosyltransferase involved in cell wall biosynthesis
MQSKDMSIVRFAQAIYPTVKLIFYQGMTFGIDKRDFLHTWMYSKLKLWITLTKKMKQEVIVHTKMPAARISIIPLGVDIHIFDTKLYNQIENRKKFGLPLTKLIIGMLGRLDPQKGQEEFIRAVPSLLKHHTDLHFVLVGEETQGQEGFKERLLNLSRKLGISNSVQLLPFTEAVAEFMSAIDIFVLPSYCETFGLVILEAMAMGKAIVATDAGGVPEIITNNSTGLLIPPRDVNSLSEALAKLIKDQELRISLSKQARSEALKRFDITYCVDQLVRSIDAL